MYNFVCKETVITEDGLDDSADLIYTAKRAPLYVLVVGPPHSRIHEVAEKLSKNLAIENLQVDVWINSLIEPWRTLQAQLKEENKDEELIKELQAKIPNFVHPIIEHLLYGGEIDVIR